MLQTIRAIEKAVSQYQVPPDQEMAIFQYLAAHPDLAPALLEAVPYIEKVFGKATRRLELEIDPEDGHQQLWGIILVDAEPEAALEKLHQFDEEWFLGVDKEVALHLNFMVEDEDE